MTEQNRQHRPFGHKDFRLPHKQWQHLYEILKQNERVWNGEITQEQCNADLDSYYSPTY